MLKESKGDLQLQPTFGKIKPETRAAPSAPPILSQSQQERQAQSSERAGREETKRRTALKTTENRLDVQQYSHTGQNGQAKAEG